MNYGPNPVTAYATHILPRPRLLLLQYQITERIIQTKGPLQSPKIMHPDLIITAGDNNYPSGESSTIDDNIGKYYHDYTNPYTGTYGGGTSVNSFFPTLGNHDVIISNAAAYLQYFALPENERYYDFIKEDVHFFAINSNPAEPDG